MNKIRVGIAGYGNIGRGVQQSISQNEDMELTAIFSRRKHDGGDKLFVPYEKLAAYKGEIDVLVLCGGSAFDLPELGPQAAALFHTVDSYDNHSRIPEYFDKMDQAAQKAGTLSLISTGWDPGLFSLMRLLSGAVLPEGKDYTFWGKGVSQGHSEAIRQVKGVRNGIQYTVPVESAVEKARSGENLALSTREKHTRLCYVVPEANADLAQIEEEIKTMPGYFADYDTTIHFITEEELAKDHGGAPHGGFVIRTGKTADGSKQRFEFALSLESNPAFTSSIMVASARAVYRLAAEGKKGAVTLYDLPLGYLSPKTPDQLRQMLL